MLHLAQQGIKLGNLRLCDGTGEAIVPHIPLFVRVDVPCLLQLLLQKGAVVGDGPLRVKQAVAQKLPAELRVRAVLHHTDGVGQGKIRAAAAVRGRPSDDADAPAHSPALLGKVRGLVEHHQVCGFYTVPQQVPAEDHVLRILGGLPQIPAGLQQTHKIRVLKVAGPVLPVDSLAQIAADAALQEIVPGQVIDRHFPVAHLGVDAKIVVKAPAPGIPKTVPQAQTRLDGEAVRHQVKPSAVVLDGPGQHQVLR